MEDSIAPHLGTPDMKTRTVQIDPYIKLGADMPKESRIELFRSLFGSSVFESAFGGDHVLVGRLLRVVEEMARV
jgi:hypothetical protein